MRDPNYFDAAIAPEQDGLQVKLLQYFSLGYRHCFAYVCIWVNPSFSVGTIYQKDVAASSLHTAITNGLTVPGNGGSSLNDYIGDWYAGRSFSYEWC